MRKLVLITQYYNDKNKTRQKEIDDTLKTNVTKDLFDFYCIITETDIELPIKNEKIKVYNIQKRLAYKDAFIICNENYKDCVCMLANSDIEFDESIHKLKDIKNDDFVVLTRYERHFNKVISHDTNMISISQDTWGFVTPVPETIIDNTDFYLGKLACDNRIAYEFYNENYKLYNPYVLIKTYHNHESNVRNYTLTDYIQGSRIKVYPTDSLDVPSKIEAIPEYITPVSYLNKSYYISSYCLINYGWIALLFIVLFVLLLFYIFVF